MVVYDLLELHSRRMRHLDADAANQLSQIATLEQDVRTWQADRVVASDEQSRAALKGRLASLKSRESQLAATNCNEVLNEYILSACEYLNIHHTLENERIDCAKSGDKERLAQIGAAMCLNTAEYVARFYPDLAATDVNRCDQAGGNVCSECGGEVTEAENCTRACSTCGLVVSTGLSDDQRRNLNWSDLRDTPSRQNTYKRLNHFREYLRQIQGRCRSGVSRKIMEAVSGDLAKHRIPVKSIDSMRVRRALKRLRMSKHYDHCHAIAGRLNPTYQPMRLDPMHEEHLCLMFTQLEGPFEEVRQQVRGNRKNFLSYPFVFYKLNELNGWDHYNTNCALLKSTTLLNEQDRWWRLIMQKLGWQCVGRTFHLQ
jgi:hypothetical protein